MIVIEESIAGVDTNGEVVTNWVPAKRVGLLGSMERVELTPIKDCEVVKIVCTDGSSWTPPRPYRLSSDCSLRVSHGFE